MHRGASSPPWPNHSPNRRACEIGVGRLVSCFDRLEVNVLGELKCFNDPTLNRDRHYGLWHVLNQDSAKTNADVPLAVTRNLTSEAYQCGHHRLEGPISHARAA